MNPLKTLTGTIASGFILALIISLMFAYDVSDSSFSINLWGIAVWLHVFFGIIWIGLLYYFNFVQVQALAKATSATEGPDGKAITTYVAPLALWWFRWAALFTWLTGVVAIEIMGGPERFISVTTVFINFKPIEIAIGAWLGTIMLFNVWVLIWPNQKKVLGLVAATDEEKLKAKSIAFTASRINTMLSIPMLLSMVSFGHSGFPIFIAI